MDVERRAGEFSERTPAISADRKTASPGASRRRTTSSSGRVISASSALLA